jgi:hypothetical protein
MKRRLIGIGSTVLVGVAALSMIASPAYANVFTYLRVDSSTAVASVSGQPSQSRSHSQYDTIASGQTCDSLWQSRSTSCTLTRMGGDNSAWKYSYAAWQYYG